VEVNAVVEDEGRPDGIVVSLSKPFVCEVRKRFAVVALLATGNAARGFSSPLISGAILLAILSAMSSAGPGAFLVFTLPVLGRRDSDLYG